MTCGHCVSAVSDAVRSVDHADEISVDLNQGSVTIVGEPNRADIVRAITAAGYGVRTDDAEIAVAPPSGNKSCRCG